MVGYGLSTPEGHFPVYSVGTEEEARRLLVAACETDLEGRFIARELVEGQTLEDLERFSERLDRTHDLLVGVGQCTCES